MFCLLLLPDLCTHYESTLHRFFTPSLHDRLFVSELHILITCVHIGCFKCENFGDSLCSVPGRCVAGRGVRAPRGETGPSPGRALTMATQRYRITIPVRLLSSLTSICKWFIFTENRFIFYWRYSALQTYMYFCGDSYRSGLTNY